MLSPPPTRKKPVKSCALLCGIMQQARPTNTSLWLSLSPDVRRVRMLPLVWRALLDEAKDGNMTAIKLYFDIFGRDIGMTDEENADPAHDEIGSLRGELFRGEET